VAAPVLVGLVAVAAGLMLLAVGCSGNDGSGQTTEGVSSSPTPSVSGTTGAAGGGAANVVQSAPVKHVKVGDLSVGYRVIGPLHGEATGSATPATPLLLVMGSSGTMDMWSPELVTALAQDRQVVVFDNRGMGETDDPLGAYPFSQLADDTAGLITALGHDQIDVLGWSMGGDVAIDLAVRHPQRVAALVSYAGDAGGRTAIPPTKAALSVLTDTSMPAQERGQKLIELLFPASYRNAHPDYATSFPIPTEQSSPKEIGLQNQAVGEWAGVWDRLKDIACPTLFVTGTEDELTPAQNSVMMADRVPASWLVRYPGAGHGLMYQDPQGLADVVLVFLGTGT
jgi:pimeloyl-ACP methyl ester carboxylesterase